MKIKTLTANELRGKKATEIEAHITELHKNLEELSHALYSGKENKTHQVSVIKKAIARAKTVQTAIAGEEK